jgi:hypothetical protein
MGARTGDRLRFAARREGAPVVLIVRADRPRAVDPIDDDRFRDEIRALGERLAGPAVVPILDAGITNGARWIVRPEIGDPIGRARPRSLLEAIAILEPVAAILSRLHAEGLVDGALDNRRLVVEEGQARIVDLAFAATTTLRAEARHRAPELVEARVARPDATADTYALALIALEIAAARPAWPTESIRLHAAILDRHTRPTPGRLGLPTSPALERLFEDLLSVDPEARPRDLATAWRSIRRAAISATEAEARPTARPHALDEPRRRARPRSVGRTAAAFALVSAGAFVVERSVAKFGPSLGGDQHDRAVSPAARSSVATPSIPPSTSAVVGAAPLASASAAPTDRSTADEPPLVLPVPDETPVFYVDRTEVTVAAYRACVDAGACTPTWQRASGYREDDPVRREWRCNLHRDGRDDHPVNCVSFEQARAYCAFVGARLPTGDEWTRAARGDHDGRRYPWGDRFPRCAQAVFARYGPDAHGCRTFAVGTRPADERAAGASPFGALDMAGSLWEWTTERDRTGNPILRGGAWDSPEGLIAIDAKLAQAPANAEVTFGIRCVRDPL